MEDAEATGLVGLVRSAVFGW